MYDNPKWQFHEDLIASYNELVTQLNAGPFGMNKGLKAAVQAASSLYHFREHLPPGIKLTSSQVKSQCPAYSLLEDITNISKHHALTRGNPTLTDASVFSDYIFIIRFEDSLGHYMHALKQVRVNLPNGDSIDVFSAVTRVLNFWGNYLVANNVLSGFNSFPEPVSAERVIVSREAASELKFETLQNWRLPGFNMQILIHDPVLQGNFPPPTPLERVRFTFRKRPSVVLNLTFSDPISGSETDVAFDLSEEEEIEFNSLKSSDTRVAFIERIMSNRKPVPQDEVSGADFYE